MKTQIKTNNVTLISNKILAAHGTTVFRYCLYFTFNKLQGDLIAQNDDIYLGFFQYKKK